MVCFRSRQTPVLRDWRKKRKNGIITNISGGGGSRQRFRKLRVLGWSADGTASSLGPNAKKAGAVFALKSKGCGKGVGAKCAKTKGTRPTQHSWSIPTRVCTPHLDRTLSRRVHRTRGPAPPPNRQSIYSDITPRCCVLFSTPYPCRPTALHVRRLRAASVGGRR